MSAVRWRAGSLLIGFCIIVGVSNFALFLRSIIRKEHHSPIPLLGGLFGVAGFFTMPLQAAHQVLWVPYVADWGSIVCFWALGKLIARRICCG